jgi:hypothetical protein
MTARILTLACCFALATGSVRADGPSKIDFNRQVRPILSNTCFTCHGPDEDVRESGLRLDIRDEAIRPADSGKAAIVPGKPKESGLVARILSKRKGIVMPPPDSHKTLSESDKATLLAWIEQGADYQTHWSFVAPSRPKRPAVRDAKWGRNPIDAFVLAKIESEGLTHSPEADKTTLIRRLTLDLTGLPPTPAEVDAFVKDPSTDAYERLVDRLLASPRFGERMALDWLDAARYADTHGFHIDSGRDMTRWRDWVIDAYNRNLPFDQFTVDQVAGDLLPNATVEQKVASGFNRNHMINFEGGAIPEEYHNAYIVDRVNTTATVWLGLTVGCAQCHDHKFDPITQKDYYRFYAFFHNVPENGLDGSKGNASPMIPAPRADQTRALSQLDKAIKEAKSALLADRPDLDASQRAWESVDATRNAVAWTVLEPTRLESRGKAKLSKQKDGSVVATGPNADRDVYTFTAPAEFGPITAIRVEALPDPSLNGGGPGRSVNGNTVLTDVTLEVSDATAPDEFEPTTLVSASADFSQETFPVAYAIDKKPETGWGLDPQEGKPHAAVFATGKPIAGGKGTMLRVILAFESPFAGHQFGKFRISATSAKDPHAKDAIPSAVAQALAKASKDRNDADRATIQSYYRFTIAPEGKALATKLASLQAEHAAIEKAVPTVMVMQEMATPRDTFVLKRGQYDQKGDKVTPGVPSSLPPLAADVPPNRLALAKWLVRPDHPLVARVTVNRLWQSFFGTGLVKTSEDFGSQGEPPSHPALLDWLAVEFVSPETPGATPWDVKAMVRRIVTSSTYRQDSRVTPDSLAKDPENRLLARAPRLRLPAEFIRDGALAVSGLLDPRIGGASVSPYQPAGLWEELASRSDGKNWTAQEYVQSHGRDLYRRTMYTFWKRTSPPPTLVTFDAPDRETCTVRRSRTNTPLQALVLLNDPTYVEASRKLAERMIGEGGDSPDARITFAFRLVMARQPSSAETDVLREVYHEAHAKFRADQSAALKLLAVGESPRNPKLDPADLAAWSTVAAVILNLDEAVTKG